MINMKKAKLNTIMSASKAKSLLCTSFSPKRRIIISNNSNIIFVKRTVNIIYLILTVFLYVF